MRFTLFFTLFSLSLFALGTQPLYTQVTSVKDDTLHAEYVTGAQVGMYGVVSHSFDDTHETALNWVKVEAINDNTLILSTTPIKALSQSALPSGNWHTKTGDKITLAYNYHRGLLIAPSSSIYKKITSYHKERNWVHPDIFATDLSALGHPSPLHEDFAMTCRNNNIGIVALMFEQSIISVDCQSFAILENKSTSITAEEENLPFYTRVPNIEANWFGDGSDTIKDYSSYYIQLLAKHNPQNEWIQKRYQKLLGEDAEKSLFEWLFGGMTITVGKTDIED